MSSSAFYGFLKFPLTLTISISISSADLLFKTYLEGRGIAISIESHFNQIELYQRMAGILFLII